MFCLLDAKIMPMGLLVLTPPSFFALGVSKENSKVAIFAMKMTMLAMGVPYSIKTDNGSTYPPTQFKVFCVDWNIACKAYIPKDKPLSSIQTLHLKKQLQNREMGFIYTHKKK